MKTLILLVLALIIAGCSPSYRHGASASPEEAAIVVMRQTLSADFDNPDELVYFPACNGIAVGERKILTARHCLTQSPVYFVDADTWYMTTSGKSPALADSGTSLIATLTPFDPLHAWLPHLAAPHDGIATVVHLRGSDIASEEAFVSGFHVDAPMTDHGDSGSAVIQDGAVVGIVELCDGDDGKTCLGTGGTFTPVVQP